jgi:hypothetical protein
MSDHAQPAAGEGRPVESYVVVGRSLGTGRWDIYSGDRVVYVPPEGDGGAPRPSIITAANLRADTAGWRKVSDDQAAADNHGTAVPST